MNISGIMKAVVAVAAIGSSNALGSPMPKPTSTHGALRGTGRQLTTSCGNVNPTDTANHLNPQITEAGETLVTELPYGVDLVSLQALQAQVCTLNGLTCATAISEYDALSNCTQSDVGKMNHMITAVHTEGVLTIWGVPANSTLTDPVMSDCTLDETGPNIPSEDYPEILDNVCDYAESVGSSICEELGVKDSSGLYLKTSTTETIRNRKTINTALASLDQQSFLSNGCPITTDSFTYFSLPVPSPAPSPAPSRAPSRAPNAQPTNSQTNSELIPTNSLYLIGSGILGTSLIFCVCYLISKFNGSNDRPETGGQMQRTSPSINIQGSLIKIQLGHMTPRPHNENPLTSI